MGKGAKEIKKKIETPTSILEKRLEDARTRIEGLQLLLRIFFLGLAVWSLFTFVFLLTQVKGQTMFPTLKDGDLMMAFRLQKEYSKGDIAVCKIDGNYYVGRVAAVATDIVTMDDTGTLTVNGTVQGGEILYPTYAKGKLQYPYRVPEGHLFLLGDYRTEALDSREFGPVNMQDVKGKVITILRRREL